MCIKEKIREDYLILEGSIFRTLAEKHGLKIDEVKLIINAPGKRKRLSNSDRANILKSKGTYKEIAAKYGVSINTIFKIYKDSGKLRRARVGDNLSQSDIDYIRGSFETIEKLSQKFGVSKTRIYEIEKGKYGGGPMNKRRKGRPPVFSPETRKLLYAMYKNGSSTTELAEIFKKSRTTIDNNIILAMEEIERAHRTG